MLTPVRVRSLGVDQRTDLPVVVLAEIDGDRILPIWIGPNEASAIALRLAEMSYDRPLTHDLLVSVIERFDANLEKVEMGRVEEGTYFASLHLRRHDEEMIVDARPSDAIAVALRMDAPLFVDDGLLVEDTAERIELDEVTPAEEEE